MLRRARNYGGHIQERLLISVLEEILDAVFDSSMSLCMGNTCLRDKVGGCPKDNDRQEKEDADEVVPSPGDMCARTGTRLGP